MTALADGLKSDVVDSWARNINEGSGSVPFLWEEFLGGSGISGGQVQVLDPENIREPENIQDPGDVQAPEDIRKSGNVQDSEGIVSDEKKFSGADGVSQDGDVDPVEGSDVEFLGGD